MTLDDLAQALRGMPRHARMVVDMADGTFRPVTSIRGLPSVLGHAGHLERDVGYTIVPRLGAEAFSR